MHFGDVTASFAMTRASFEGQEDRLYVAVLKWLGAPVGYEFPLQMLLSDELLDCPLAQVNFPTIEDDYFFCEAADSGTEVFAGAHKGVVRFGTGSSLARYFEVNPAGRGGGVLFGLYLIEAPRRAEQRLCG
jgi:hypothetical protein